jgi:DNA-binding MarR family transcriptional regulator
MLPKLKYNLIGEVMDKIDIMEKQKFILAQLFLLPNKLQARGDRIFAGEMTLRQWLLTLAVAQYGETPPILSTIAEIMGSSHQNVKQLALKLEKRGYIDIEKDEKDLRLTRLILTEKSYDFWKRRREEIRDYLAELFKDLGEEEINLMHDCIRKLYDNVFKMGKGLSK